MDIHQKRRFFFQSCEYNTFSFYILRMRSESKKEKLRNILIRVTQIIGDCAPEAVIQPERTNSRVVKNNHLKLECDCLPVMPVMFLLCGTLQLYFRRIYVYSSL